MKFLVPLSLALLAGCAHLEMDNGNACDAIQVKSYAPSFQIQLSAEVATASKTSVWPQAILDYRDLRSAVRACQGKDPHGRPLPTK